MTSTTPSSRKHHFFLFRHCVRATTERYDVGNGFPPQLQAYVSERLPDYGVPSFWCTEASLPIVENTGYWLLQSGMIDGKRIQFQVISDTSHRDVDTAFSLSRGLLSAGTKMGLDVSGLNSVDFHREIFDPVGSGLCKKRFSDDDTNAAIQSRMDSLPQPELSMEEALQILQNVAGVGDAGPLSLESNNQTDSKLDLLTASRIVKNLAEVLFYSRAGGVDPPFAPTATVSDVYRLLEWNYWERSASHVNVPDGATRGAPLAHAMLQILKQGYYQQGAQHTSDYDTRVTILAGHDLDSDSMATALGVQWELLAPYVSGENGAFVPTPPMSGIHAEWDMDTDSVSLSFVYPMYSEVESTDWRTNTSGILESSPLLFNYGPKLSGASSNAATTIVTGDDQGNVTSIDVLSQHVQQILDTYPGALECYQDTARSYDAQAVFSSSTSTTRGSTSSGASKWQISSDVLMAVVCFGAVVLSIYYIFARKAEKVVKSEAVPQQEPSASEEGVV